MKIKVEITDINPNTTKLDLTKEIKDLLQKNKNAVISFKRKINGGKSFETFSIVINGNEIYNYEKVKWGDTFYLINPDCYIHTIEFSKPLNIEKVEFEIEVYIDLEVYREDDRPLIKDNTIHVDTFKEVPFEDFKKQALHKLQRQFLSIPDTKDTVLTRKNIIEMIKDLKELKG